MDSETKQILGQQKDLKSLTEHPAWGILRARLTDKIMSLQNAFDIDITDERKMFIDLQARKIAAHTLFTFLADIEGTASEADDFKEVSKESYILRKD